MLLTPGLVLIWALGKLIPSTVRGIPGHKVRMLLAVAVMSSVIMSAAAYVVISYMGNTGFRKDTVTWLDVTVLIISIILGVAGAASFLILLLSASVRLMQRTVAQNGPREQLGSLLAGKLHRLKSSVSLSSISMLRFAGLFFVLFYFALAIVCLYTWYVVHPLYFNINSISRSRSGLDELFVRLSLVGGILSGVLLYYRGFISNRKETPQLSAGSWRSFLGNLRRSVLPSSIRRGFVWSLGGAYVFSLIVASLIAFLEPPPLPRVDIAIKNNSSLQRILPSESQTPDSLSDPKRLLAHTDGYWYLFDEQEKQLLILPNGNDFAIWFPHFVNIANSYESIQDGGAGRLG